MTEPTKALQDCLNPMDMYLDSDLLRDSVNLLSRTLMEPEVGDNDYGQQSTVQGERRAAETRGGSQAKDHRES